MTREAARRVIDRLRIRVIDSDADGIVLERYETSDLDGVGGQHASRPFYTRWRLYTGGGIAGNGGCFWIRRIQAPVNSPTSANSDEPRGPFRTQKQLKSALRAFRRGEWR